ncbi:MAG: hypothetical protein ACOX6T_00695 [Myxococcales bacterium]|jgi:hypothetical protein
MNGSLVLIALGMALAASPDSASFGAVATAPLERGSLSFYGMGGYPELRAGFREGMRGYEIGGELGFDVRLVKLYGVASARLLALDSSSLRVSIDVQGGGFASSGARWAEPQNERGAGLRLMLGSTLTYKADWPFALTAYLKAPLEVPLSDLGTTRLTAMLGGAAELAIARGYFVTFGGGFGPEFRRYLSQPEGSLHLAVEAMVGVGYRMF